VERTEVPYSWVGSRVEAVVMHGWLDEDTKDRGLTAWKHRMTLLEVGSLGVLSISEGSADQDPRFLPWTSILSMRVLPS